MIISANGNIKSIYAVRFGPGEDVYQGILKFCEENGIGHGVIISGIGSLEGAAFFDPAPLPGKEGLYGYSDPIRLPCPIELISLNGIICTGEAGDIQLHIHCSMADQTGAGYAGHFIEGNKVLTTVELIIGELSGIFMGRKLDPERGVSVFHPTKAEIL